MIETCLGGRIGDDREQFRDNQEMHDEEIKLRFRKRVSPAFNARLRCGKPEAPPK